MIYAQADPSSPWGKTEDSFIGTFFRGKKDGFFIDIGAHDGRSYSNTRPLWQAGWSGILIEPCSDTFAKLLENYPDKSRLEFINAAICQENGPIEFAMHSDPDRSGWHSIVPGWISTWDPAKVIKTTVKGIRFDSLKLPAKVDFLSVDTEGYDATILETLPEDFRPRLIMCEVDKNGVRERVEREMERRKYRFLWGTYLNSAYTAL